jgi:AcrR family transcriptional regulator
MKRPRKSRKSEIVATFTTMVAERGYDAVSLRDVAEALGMSKGTIVHHFQSKELLLERLHFVYMRRRLDEAAAMLEQLDRPAERLGALVYQLMLAQRDDRDATVAFAREISRFANDDSMVDVRRLRQQYFDQVRDVIEEGMADGSFEPADATVVTFMIFGMCNWSWTWFRVDGSLSAEHVAESYLHTVLNGILVGRPEEGGVDLDHVLALVRETMSRARDDASAPATSG